MGGVWTRETCGTSSVPRMHVARSRTASTIEITVSVSAAMRGTMTYMAHTMTNPLDVIF
jgi:hypothetical protein